MVGIPDGRAITIMEVLQNLCEDNEFDFRKKLVAFGSDGASIMAGKRNGVSALLKQLVLWVIANHCMAHRLALYSAQTTDEIPYNIKKFKATLGQLYRFYGYSGVLMTDLEEIQTVLNDPQLKLTEAKDVQWL